MSYFALLTFTLMETCAPLKSRQTVCTSRKMAGLAHYFPDFSFNSDDIYGCERDPFENEWVNQHFWLNLFPVPCCQTTNNWFPLCHQWCFAVKVHKRDDGAIMGAAIKWFLNGIFETLQLRDISRRNYPDKTGQQVTTHKCCSPFWQFKSYTCSNGPSSRRLTCLTCSVGSCIQHETNETNSFAPREMRLQVCVSMLRAAVTLRIHERHKLGLCPPSSVILYIHTSCWSPPASARITDVH